MPPHALIKCIDFAAGSVVHMHLIQVYQSLVHLYQVHVYLLFV